MPNWLAGERKTFSRLVIEGGDEIGVGGGEIPDVEEGERVQRVDDHDRRAAPARRIGR